MKNALTLIFVIILIISCKPDHINKEILLKINDLQVTSYEINRYLERNGLLENDSTNKLTNNEIINKVVDNYLIVADAYEKKYDTLNDHIRNVELVSEYMMTDKDKYLWNNQMLPVVEKFKKATPERKQKRSKLYYFHIIATHNKEFLLDLLEHDPIIESVDEFQKLKQLCTEHEEIHYANATAQWPFSNWYTLSDTLFNMQVGEISNLLYQKNTYFYFYLSQVEQIQLTEENIDQLLFDLQYYKEQEIIDEKLIEILATSKPILNHNAVDSVFSYLTNGNDIFQYPNNNILIQYYINDSLIKMRYYDFIEIYRYMPITLNFENKDILIEQINRCFHRNYLSNEARQLDLYNDDAFSLDQKYYKNSLLYKAYIQNEILDKIVVDSLEIAQYYQDNINNFRVPKYKYVTCFLFDSEEIAMSNWETLSNYYRNNLLNMTMKRSAIPDLKAILNDYKIDMEKCEGFDKNETFKIHHLMLGQVSMSIQFKNMHALLLNTKTEGEYLLSLDVVTLFITEEISREKQALVMEQKLKTLRANSTIEINKLNRIF